MAKSIPASYIVIRVTPQFAGVFTIPGLTPKSATVGLEVYTGDALPIPTPGRSEKPVYAAADIPKALRPERHSAESRGRGTVQLVVPAAPFMWVESVPVDIELGIRPGIVTSLNGPPALTGSDFTLNNLSKQHRATR